MSSIFPDFFEKIPKKFPHCGCSAGISACYKITSCWGPARPCRPCRAAGLRGWSQCHRPADGSPGRRSAYAAGPRRYCSGYGPAGSFRSHPYSGCAGGGPGRRPDWSSCKLQSISAGGGSRPRCRSS